MRLNPIRTTRLVLALLLPLAILTNAPSAHAAGEAPDVLAIPVCEGPDAVRFSPELMQRKVLAYQKLTEEALSLRARALAYLRELKEKQLFNEPLLGADMRRLSAGAAELVAQRRQLWQVATAHECWLEQPFPADPYQARVQAMGIAMSLSAALTLYDNYITAVALYRDNRFLRNHINQGDAGFSVPEGELRRSAAAFASATNRARVRRGIEWYEAHGRTLADSDYEDERYLAALVEQSPSYAMVRKARPLDYASNVLGLVTTVSTDTLRVVESEGVNLSSMVFGNVVGLVESRRGKLDGDDRVYEAVRAGLQAGDVLLEKTPFRLTDSFIPGHWGHAAVWIGTEAELRDLGLWEHPVVAAHRKAISRGRGVVEALRSGVEMNSLQHFLNVDDLAVLRHRALSDDARREVILQALRQVGKAYDFNFDTQSADRIVCSELVYHAYGDVRWPTERTLGRVVVSPDNIAQEATGEGVFDVALLYHDGQQVSIEPRTRLAGLIEKKVVMLAHDLAHDMAP